MKILSNKLHDLVFKHPHLCREIKKTRNDEAQKVVEDEFNHCSVLMYYGVDGVKKASKLGIHCDCVYNKKKKFLKTFNSQKENTITVSVSIGDPRVLKHFERYAYKKSNSVYSNWVLNKEDWIESLLVDGTITVIHPCDERPFNFKINGSDYLTQIQHGKVNVTKGLWSACLVFRTVTNICNYEESTGMLKSNNSRNNSGVAIKEDKAFANSCNDVQ